MPNVNDNNINFEIEEEIAVLSESGNGWRVELNKVSWNGHEAKYDIRRWAPDHERPGKGISLSEEEMGELLDALANVNA